MRNLTGRRVDFEDVSGKRFVGTLAGSTSESGVFQWIFERCYYAFYTYEDGSNPHDWHYKGTVYFQAALVKNASESLLDESNIKEPLGRGPG